MQANYDLKIFNQLDNLEVANERSLANSEKLKDIGDVICCYELHEIVGVCLLHRHFNLKPGERVIRESVDNKFSIKPQLEPNWDCIAPYSWKIEKNRLSGFSYYPLEFFNTTTVDIEIKNRSEYVMSYKAFLVDMAMKLSELELMDTFGIAILFNEFLNLEKGHFLLEATDDNRMQTFELTTASSLGSEIATQTLWKFTPHQQKLYLSQESNQSRFWNFLAQK